jgi:hypothetical protein
MSILNNFKNFFKVAPIFLLVLTSCDSTTTPSNTSISALPSQSILFRPDVSFYYSVDDGRSYSDGIKQLPVGDVVFMRIYVRVNTSNASSYLIKADITIPNIEGIEAFYNSGQIITPEDDKLANEVTWPVDLIASVNPEVEILTFKFVPLSPSSQTIYVIFDDNVLALYDAQDTVTFFSDELESSQVSSFDLNSLEEVTPQKASL